ncbi:MAG: tyrosine-type recombinase/integrase [Opitutaceae bacterium]
MPPQIQRNRGQYTPKQMRDGKWLLKWPVQGITPSGKQKIKSATFKTKQAAIAFAAKINSRFREEGFKRETAIVVGENSPLAIPDTDGPKTMYEAAEEYISAYEASLKAHDKRVRKNPKHKKRRANEVLASAGEHTDTYVSRNTLETKYAPPIRRLCSKSQLGDLPLEEVTASDLRLHLELQDYAISTYNERIGLFERFFKWCIDPRRGYLNASPVAGLTRLKDEWQEPEILTTDEISDLFRAAEKIDPGLIPVLTLRVHAGLRSCEVKRMSADDIKWDQRLIDIRGEVAKRYSPDRPLPRKLEGLPDAVWLWLESVGGRNVKIDTCNLYKRMLAILEEAGVEYKRNCLRHSFCSYAYSLLGDDGVVRKWSGHRKASAFFDNYVNVSLSSKAEAKEFFKLRPTGDHSSRLGNRRKRHQPTIQWPTTSAFRELIMTMSNVKIAKELNCTEAAVRKERKKRGI